MSKSDHRHPDKAEETHLSDEELGLAGRTARFFIRSPLSPLFYMAMMLMGLMGLIMTPRQEDPQISVPMVDIFVQYPGASAEQVALLAIEPLERIMSEIKGVKHVYSMSDRGQGMVTIEFEVGQQMGPSLVKVNDKLDSNMDKIPPGVMHPLVRAKGIDDVPVVNITLWSTEVDDGQLRMLAQDVLQSVKEIPNTGNGFIVGGRREQVRVEVFPEKISGYGISLDQVANTIKTANSETRAGGVESGNAHLSVVTGSFLRSAEDINRLVVGTHQSVPLYVHDVARVTQGPEDTKEFVTYYTGPASTSPVKATGASAVTIAVAKKEGSNGVSVANAIIERVNELKANLIPSNVQASVTRNYGETANDKVNELLFKLFMATSFVFFLVLGAFVALRPAIVVVLVIPVVLLMTVFSAWLTGYTIDRVSLFALIFSIGILVDDAIVVVENIYRRWLEEGRTDVNTAVDAVREVGNPTILATLTVIAALLPMGFVTGMMGPYMLPIPVLGSIAMLISLFAAFVFTPYFAISKWLRPTMRYLAVAEAREHRQAESLEKLFRRALIPLIESPFKRRLFRLVMWGAFLFTCAFFYTQWVAVKMLPLDNKPEFCVVLDMPDGTALPTTVNTAGQIADKLLQMPEVTAVQVYAGTSRPFDFNGMVRHYYLRDKPWFGEIQVQLLSKKQRKRSSHQLAVQAREDLKAIAKASRAHLSVVEMPPGPPVLQSVVAEVHGPEASRRQVAKDLTRIFEEAENTRDTDNYLREPYDYWRFSVDTEKAVRRGVSVDAVNRNLVMALGGTTLGDIKQRAGREPINIVIQVPLAERSEVTRLGDLPIPAGMSGTLPLREVGRFEKVHEEDLIFHKDLRSVEYVVADVGGRLAAPVYAMLQVQDLLKQKNYKTPEGVALEASWIGPPKGDRVSAYEWSGEWTVTYETFRDMGAAFCVALVMIYVLVVWEFGNFRIPALIMAPIPLTLLGIIPMHWVMNAEFTATSMIGWIALAGIIVRNSILLVDFAIHEVQRGVPAVEAVLRSCKARTRPIMITALALVCGSSVIFTDPIFQGMAISLASGVMVSTLLTLIVIPLGCIEASKDLCAVAMATAPAGTTLPCLEEVSIPSRRRSSSRGSALVWLWGKVAGILMMLFYIVRGIILLLVQVVGPKSKPKPKPKPVSAPPAPAEPVPVPAASQANVPMVAESTRAMVAQSLEAPSSPIDTASVPEPQLVSGPPQERLETGMAAPESSEVTRATIDAPMLPVVQEEAHPIVANQPSHVEEGHQAADEGSKMGPLEVQPVGVVQNPAADDAEDYEEVETSVVSGDVTPKKNVGSQKKVVRRGIRLKKD
ncbi:Acriflavin resistance protein [Gammaproteobacteria bacterium]